MNPVNSITISFEELNQLINEDDEYVSFDNNRFIYQIVRTALENNITIIVDDNYSSEQFRLLKGKEDGEFILEKT